MRFADQTGLSVKEARKILAASTAMTPEIPRWHEEVKAILLNKGILRNCWGQERQCYEAIGARIATGTIPDTIWKDAIAWEPQSAIPQVINRAMQQLDRSLPDIWWHQHGHDSFLASLPIEQATRETREAILTALDTELKVGGYTIHIPADLQIGYNWGWLFPWHEECSKEWWLHHVQAERKKGRADTISHIMGALLFIGGLPPSSGGLPPFQGGL
jgi:hypothetical protein